MKEWLILGGAGLFLVLFILDYKKRKSCKIPGPPPLPFIGNTIEGMKAFDRILDFQYENTLKYGQTWTFTMLGQPRRIFTSNPLNVEHILKKNFENYEKGEIFRERLHDLLGEGIFAVDGEKWKVQRKTASNIFSVKNFRDNMCDVFAHHGAEVLKLLEQLKPGESINMHDVLHRFTLDSIGDIAFGAEIGSIRDPQVPFARAFDFAQLVAFERFTSPIWKLNKIFSPREAKFRESVKILKANCDKIIQERREKGVSEDRVDLLSLFMTKTDHNGKPFSDEYLRDMIMNFVIAGRDTTANGLSWAFYVLSQYPDVEQKLVEEIEETFGDEEPDYRVKEMKYMTCFVSETLRLYPSVPKDPKIAVKEDVLPDGTGVTPGDMVVYLPYTMGRLKELWGEDAFLFRPERWMEDQKPSPFKFPVFQAGPRTCLGQDMAYLEMKMLLCLVLQKFSLRLKEGQKIEYQNSITLPMKNAEMLMTVQRRERK